MSVVDISAFQNVSVAAVGTGDLISDNALELSFQALMYKLLFTTSASEKLHSLHFTNGEDEMMGLLLCHT
mgnify:CR=1 FL=1